MKEKLFQILEESINLELNVADLYQIFYNTFTIDAAFWWKLIIEEKNHAALVRSVKEYFMPSSIIPYEMLSTSLRELEEINNKITSLINKYQDTPPSREEAFNIAFELEESAGEIHLQKFTETDTNSKIDEIFQKLNGDDKDHAMRIRSYMENNNIELKKII